jgi:hypothetical protein
MRKIGVLAIGATATADEGAHCMGELELMMKDWALDGPFLFTKRETTQTLVAATAAYTLSTAKPIRIIEARYRSTATPQNDLPMQPLTRDEYFGYPNKTATGTPTTYYFDPVAANPVLYIWPLLASATTEAVAYTYQRRIEDITSLNNNIDIPQEWLGTCGYALAARLLDDFGIADEVGNRILARSEQMMQKAKDFEREEFVFMRPGFYRY